MRCWSPCSLLVVIVLYCLSSHRSDAFDLAQACVESQRLSLLPICETILAVQQDGAQQSADDGLRSKRFIRFGRALSGDAFLRFGKNVPDLPFEDKRFLRFGRAAPQLDDLLKQALQRVESLQKVDETNVRRKRSTDAAPHSSNAESAEPKNESAAKITKRYAVEDTEDTDVKRFMRFGKRFMRFGRNPADLAQNKLNEKRFMRFGRDPEKRFMRFGKSDDKRFMRFGRNPADAEDELEEEKRFMRFGRGGEEDDEDIEDAEKRFMRFGRDPEKRFMRFGKNNGGVEDKRFMRFGRNPEEQEADKRFMRFGRGGAEDGEGMNTEDKRFMRFGRSAEKCKGCLEG